MISVEERKMVVLISKAESQTNEKGVKPIQWYQYGRFLL